MSYLSAPLWFMFLALSTAFAGGACVDGTASTSCNRVSCSRFGRSGDLNWRSRCLLPTMVLLFLPKLLVFCSSGVKGRRVRRVYPRHAVTSLLEVLFSDAAGAGAYVVPHRLRRGAFLGWEVVGIRRQRDDDSTRGEAFMRLVLEVTAGAGVGCGYGWLDLRFLFWLAPIVFSLILSPFVSVISAVPRWGYVPSAGSCS